MRHLIVLGLIATLATACASGPTQTPGTSLDTELVDLVRDGDRVGGIKIRTDAGGRVVKMAVYHADAAALPVSIREQAGAKWPGGQLRSYETEWYASVGRVYEVEIITAEGTACEWSVTGGGDERYVECEIPLNSIPEAVVEAVARALPAGEIEEAESHEESGGVIISMEVKANGREYYVRVRDDGQLVDHFVRVPTILEVPVR